jgi:hypothetical protein
MLLSGAFTPNTKYYRPYTKEPYATLWVTETRTPILKRRATLAKFDNEAMLRTLEWAHKNLDELKVKEQVDKKGIDGFINYCAGLAAATGAAAGIGGGITLVLGVPADVANTIAQQFRVTLGVIYHRTGRYSLSFEEFIKIVAVSLGVEIGTQGVLLGVNYIAKQVATEIVKRLTAQTAGRIIPVVGAVVGGGMNFAFIKALGKTLLALDDKIFD